MAEAKAVHVDDSQPRFEQVSFIALPAEALRRLSAEGAKRGLTASQLLANAVDEYLRNHPTE